MGVYAVYENAIRIMVPRDLHLGDEEFDQLKVGDRIRVEIQKSRFQLRDPFIVSVAVYRGYAGSTLPTQVLPAKSKTVPVVPPTAPIAVAAPVPQTVPQTVAAPVAAPVPIPVTESEEESGAEEEEEEEATEE